MFNSTNKFHNLYPSEKSVKILSLDEKKYILDFFNDLNINIHTVYDDDILCKELDAKIDDIICIRYTTTDIYRRVISKKIDN